MYINWNISHGTKGVAEGAWKTRVRWTKMMSKLPYHLLADHRGLGVEVLELPGERPGLVGAGLETMATMATGPTETGSRGCVMR